MKTIYQYMKDYECSSEGLNGFIKKVYTEIEPVEEGKYALISWFDVYQEAGNPDIEEDFVDPRSMEFFLADTAHQLGYLIDEELDPSLDQLVTLMHICTWTFTPSVADEYNPAAHDWIAASLRADDGEAEKASEEGVRGWLDENDSDVDPFGTFRGLNFE